MVSDPLRLVGAVPPPQEFDLSGASGSGCCERGSVIVVIAGVGVGQRRRIESLGIHKGPVRLDGGLAKAAVVSFYGAFERLVCGTFQSVGVELEFVQAGVQRVPSQPATHQ